MAKLSYSFKQLTRHRWSSCQRPRWKFKRLWRKNQENGDFKLKILTSLLETF
jgi:hypothetical protein